MTSGTTITSITARQIYSGRGHPGVRATVTTANDASASIHVTAGTSVGKYEVQFAYDEAETKFGGRGVGRAVHNIEQIIAPALVGMDATRQGEIDQRMLALDGTPDKRNLGGNALAAVSAAVLQAAAKAVGLPLYRYIGGLNACLLPVPGVLVITGARRYGGGESAGSKPTYSLMCHGFTSFREASYAAWEVEKAFYALVWKKLKLDTVSRRQNTPVISPGYVKHDRELWALMVEAIGTAGYEGKIGIQVDVAAGTYYDEEKQRYIGLFSAEDKTREEMLALYKEAVRDYPFVIIEDPLDEDDFEGHALLTRTLGIQVVGDDLFTTNLERVRHGVALGAANTVLLKVNQVGTISEAFEMVQYAYRHGYGVMPCNSRGEGEVIADYTVGLGCGQLREGATGPVGDRFLEIEEELGSRAIFAGRKGLKP
jgi:enolase